MTSVGTDGSEEETSVRQEGCRLGNKGPRWGDSDKVSEQKVFNYALTLRQSTEK